jgi:hypothetical protein
MNELKRMNRKEKKQRTQDQWESMGIISKSSLAFSLHIAAGQALDSILILISAVLVTESALIWATKIAMEVCKKAILKMDNAGPAAY